jgi:hypothetical protein
MDESEYVIEQRNFIAEEVGNSKRARDEKRIVGCEPSQ